MTQITAGTACEKFIDIVEHLDDTDLTSVLRDLSEWLGRHSQATAKLLGRPPPSSGASLRLKNFLTRQGIKEKAKG